MKFEDISFSAEHRYALGREIESGEYYLSIPVSNSMVDYEEYYKISPEEFEQFSNNVTSASEFAQQCRCRALDDRLMVKPGTERGSAN